MSNDTRSTGTDLKVERVRARIEAKAVAKEMGISGSRLSRIEGPDKVTDRMRVRYLEALERAERAARGEAA